MFRINLIKRYIYFLLLGFWVSIAHANVIELTWDELIPSDYVFVHPLDTLTDEEYEALIDGSDAAQNLMDEIRRIQDAAPVVEALNGQAGRISGYALPLDFEAEDVSEFLLVPYFGACIHVPPPPGNQTVYVRLDTPVKLDALWDPVTVTGTIETVRISTELAAAGYQMQAVEVQPYVYQ